jgi:hypothetical protein
LNWSTQRSTTLLTRQNMIGKAFTYELITGANQIIYRLASAVPTEPSNYMQTLTRYLSNIMNSTLLGLPREIKELIYFDALSHAAEKILVSHLSNPNIPALPMHINRPTRPYLFHRKFDTSMGMESWPWHRT